MSQDSIITKKAIDWRWLVVSFCFLVLFHLFPSSLASDLRPFISLSSWVSFTLWGVGGIAAVSAYVGFRSGGKAILEPGLAALLYIFLLRSIVSRTGNSADFFGPIPVWVAFLPIAYLIGCAGAIIGAWFHRRREKTNAADLIG